MIIIPQVLVGSLNDNYTSSTWGERLNDNYTLGGSLHDNYTKYMGVKSH